MSNITDSVVNRLYVKVPPATEPHFPDEIAHPKVGSESSVEAIIYASDYGAPSLRGKRNTA